jgi:predicted transposase YdaD
MLMAEWKLEDALVVEREEGFEEGREEGFGEGREEGFGEGREEGWKERGEKDREETIRNLLDFGMKTEQISRALKLPLDAVRRYLK